VIKKFFPILKTKSNSEPNAIKECLGFLGDYIIPYVEVIPEKEESVKKRKSGFDKIRSLLKDKSFIAQCNRSDKQYMGTVDFGRYLEDTFSLTKSLNSNVCISIFIRGEQETFNYKKVNEYIELLHELGYQVAVRCDCFNDNVARITDSLELDDYFIFDIGFSDISASFFVFMDIEERVRNPHFLVFSQEINHNLGNKNYSERGYNDGITNTSLMNYYVKQGNDIFGIGGSCGTKNDTNEFFRGTMSYALFLTYDSSKNSFYSMRSEKSGEGSTAYRELVSKIESHFKYYEYGILKNCPISTELLKKQFETHKPGNASTYIKITIINYLEQINNLLSGNN